MVTALAIHIGLDGVDPTAYAGWDGTLDACENDAEAMADITRRLGYQGRTLLTGQATAAAVFAEISRAATALGEGDICVITYAGHGGQFDDLSGDEPDRKDETWLLYDREVLDDEIRAALSGFSAGVRVVVVSDSCHSGSVIRDHYEQYLRQRAFREPYLRVAPGLPSRARARRRSAGPRIREAPGSVQSQVLAQHGDLYRRMRASTPRPDALDLPASVILLAGCQDNQVSLEFDGHGAFTAALLDQWDGDRFAQDYQALTAAIKRTLPPTQTPGLLVLGAPWQAFEQQPGFTLDPPAGAQVSVSAGAATAAQSGIPTASPPGTASPPDATLHFSLDVTVSSSSSIGARLLEVLAGGGGAPARSRGGLATLALDTLTCQTPDDWGGDEPVLVMDGDEVWRASGMDAGDSRSVGVRRSFVGSAVLELFDAEDLIANDSLGQRVIDSDEAGLGQRNALFNQSSSARYVLQYHVE